MEAKKITSIELGRLVAIFVVVAMHCQMFLSYFLYQDTPWFGFIFNQSTRFAVPLFFLISGFLIQPKLTATPMTTLKRYCTPLMRVFIVWSVICLLMPFNLQTVLTDGYLAERSGYWGYLMQAPVNTLLEGGLVHLWFIPALMIAALITALLLNAGKGAWLLPIAVVLYVYGVLAGSYVNLTELWSPFFTRNGPFFSTLMFAIGFVIREKNIRTSSAQAIMLALVGMALHFSEAYWLTSFDQPFNGNDFLFGTLLWGTGTFLFLLAKPNLGNTPWVLSLSKSVLAIYVSHLPIIILMMNVAGGLQLNGPLKDAVVFSGTIILTLLLVKGVEKTPLNQWLFR
ncbi:acyltransferase [Vibrio panuliri]|uniref:Fucose 4-O-acetylase n=1 Tax=Vibrio panuliri TaxID=1381081 RepID=A0ABX3FCI0_9VIBR|nr:acyltransferase family protein [Vibrio panuliri]KAB1458118.1 acyltransferase family protein [Vibrio panuliri]OLQ89498.1 fucose 4-O-acetylase [Vibrio panuliri]